jgi:photosystem II stability/assembly factor-like uncharacterized protein
MKNNMPARGWSALGGKKHLLAILFPLILILSGCSLTGSSGTSTATGSFWKSADGGKVWEVKNKISEKTTIPEADVLSLVINPQDPANILFGTVKNGIYKTADGGENWSAVNFQSEKVYGLAMDPRDPQTIYASGIWQKRGKIFKSADQGTTWEEIYTSVSSGTLVISLTMSNKNPDVLYVSTSDNQILQTSDGGHTWENLFLAASPVVKIALDYQDENLLYFNTVSGEIFRSQDGGKTIEEISQKFLPNWNMGGSVRLVETDPRNRNWVYAGGKIGIILSKNSGETWEKINILNNPENFPVSALAINPLNSEEFVYGSAQASFKTEDGGKTWTTAQFNTAKTINLIRYDPQNTQNVFIGLSKINY